MEFTACIFVDGENLRHSLKNRFSEDFEWKDYLPRDADWAGLRDLLVDRAGAHNRLRTYWYVVENINIWPYKLGGFEDDLPRRIRLLESDECCKGELRRMADVPSREQWAIAKLHDLKATARSRRSRFEGWKVFQDGISSRHESVEFQRSGAIHFNLFDRKLSKEKAVGVHLAADLLRLKDIYYIGIILSGGQDSVPAVKAAKDYGKQLVNVSFLRKSGQVLPGGARRLNQATDRRIGLGYGETRAFIHFSAPPAGNCG